MTHIKKITTTYYKFVCINTYDIYNNRECAITINKIYFGFYRFDEQMIVIQNDKLEYTTLPLNMFKLLCDVREDKLNNLIK